VTGAIGGNDATVSGVDGTCPPTGKIGEGKSPKPVGAVGTLNASGARSSFTWKVGAGVAGSAGNGDATGRNGGGVMFAVSTTVFFVVG